jgi:hypothetical protein
VIVTLFRRFAVGTGSGKKDSGPPAVYDERTSKLDRRCAFVSGVLGGGELMLGEKVVDVGVEG